MRKPGEYSGIEGITFIHDFRDESIRYVRQSVRFYARAHKADTHTRTVAREDAKVVARIPLRGLQDRLLSFFDDAIGVFNVEFLRIGSRYFKTCCNTKFCLPRYIK